MFDLFLHTVILLQYGRVSDSLANLGFLKFLKQG